MPFGRSREAEWAGPTRRPAESVAQWVRRAEVCAVGESADHFGKAQKRPVSAPSLFLVSDVSADRMMPLAGHVLPGRMQTFA